MFAMTKGTMVCAISSIALYGGRCMKRLSRKLKSDIMKMFIEGKSVEDLRWILYGKLFGLNTSIWCEYIINKIIREYIRKPWDLEK